MTVPVVLPPEAEEQVHGIDIWWRGNRPLAPGLFTEELAAAFELLGAAPFAGRRYPHPEVQDRPSRFASKHPISCLLQGARRRGDRARSLERCPGDRPEAQWS